MSETENAPPAARTAPGTAPDAAPEPAPEPALEIDIEARVGTMNIQVHLCATGNTLALVGPNGAGKSSTLLCALGILRPRTGRIALGDRVLFEAHRRDGGRSGGRTRVLVDLATEERGLGYVPQHHALFPHLTAVDNVIFALACRGRGMRSGRDNRAARRGRLDRGQRRDRALAMLRDLGVAHVADQLPATLSGGEAQRVALARALVAEPAALLLDEPFAAVDAGARPALRDLVRAQIAIRNRPAILVTHDLGDAAALASTIAVMENGRIVQAGSIEALQARPATRFVAGLVASRSG